jgi:putative FmdB family regulatory protein
MPTYVYRREDGTTFETQQSIKDDALTVCPTTGQAVTRVIASGTGLIFKGSGFYQTDYARKGGSTTSEPPANGSGSSDTSDKSGASPKAATDSGATADGVSPKGSAKSDNTSKRSDKKKTDG